MSAAAPMIMVPAFLSELPFVNAHAGALLVIEVYTVFEKMPSMETLPDKVSLPVLHLSSMNGPLWFTVLATVVGSELSDRVIVISGSREHDGGQYAGVGLSVEEDDAQSVTVPRGATNDDRGISHERAAAVRDAVDQSMSAQSMSAQRGITNDDRGISQERAAAVRDADEQSISAQSTAAERGTTDDDDQSMMAQRGTSDGILNGVQRGNNDGDDHSTASSSISTYILLLAQQRGDDQSTTSSSLTPTCLTTQYRAPRHAQENKVAFSALDQTKLISSVIDNQSSSSSLAGSSTSPVYRVGRGRGRMSARRAQSRTWSAGDVGRRISTYRLTTIPVQWDAKPAAVLDRIGRCTDTTDDDRDSSQKKAFVEGVAHGTTVGDDREISRDRAASVKDAADDPSTSACRSTIDDDDQSMVAQRGDIKTGDGQSTTSSSIPIHTHRVGFSALDQTIIGSSADDNQSCSSSLGVALPAPPAYQVGRGGGRAQMSSRRAQSNTWSAGDVAHETPADGDLAALRQAQLWNDRRDTIMDDDNSFNIDLKGSAAAPRGLDARVTAPRSRLTLARESRQWQHNGDEQQSGYHDLAPMLQEVTPQDFSDQWDVGYEARCEARRACRVGYTHRTRAERSGYMSTGSETETSWITPPDARAAPTRRTNPRKEKIVHAKMRHWETASVIMQRSWRRRRADVCYPRSFAAASHILRTRPCFKNYYEQSIPVLIAVYLTGHPTSSAFRAP